MITLATYTYSRAQLLRTRLESEGVRCYLKNLNLIQSAVGSGVKVRIKEEDLHRVLKIIEDLDLDYSQEDLEAMISQKNTDMSRILVPVDFSDSSPKLCDYAVGIAKKFNADILLFHSYCASLTEVAFSDSYMHNPTISEALFEVEKNAKIEIKKLYYDIRDRLKKEKVDGIKVDYNLSAGDSSSLGILNICNKYKPNLIIMGSRGETANTTNLLGSVVSSVIEQADVPILILSDQRDQVDFDKIHNIMYATDFDEADFRAIANLKYIAKSYNIKIHCVHFTDKLSHDPMKEHHMQILRKYIKRYFGDSGIEYRIVYEDEKKEGIKKYIYDHDIGLIAILARKHNLLEKLFIGQMSRKLFIGTHMPILVFH